MNEIGGPTESPLAPTGQRLEQGWRVNIICLIGAVLSVVSVFLVWVKARLFFWGVELNLIDLLNEASESSSGDGTQVLIACLLILVGSVLAFLTATGVILHLIGVPLYLEWFLSESEGRLPSGAGPYVAIAAIIIILAGIVRPIGLGYGRKPPGIKGRLLTFSPKSSVSAYEPIERESTAE